MVKETVAPHLTDLQMDLISGCLFHSDLCEAAFWAKHFNIKIDDLPILVQDYIRET